MTPPPAGTLPPPRLETLSADGRPLAQWGLLAAGAHDTSVMAEALDARDRQRADGFSNPERRTEYIASRWLLGRLQVQGPSSLSHCRRWLAAAATPWAAIGVDVECRLPRAVDEVAERLGWEDVPNARYLQAWTLWEAWRKLERGSVLDAPDLPYALALRESERFFDGPSEVSGAWWFSRDLGDAVLSVVVRRA